MSPIRIIRVEPEPAGTAAATDATAPVVDPPLAKLSPSLLAVLGDGDAASKRTRLDVILYDAPDAEDRRWRDRLNAAPNLVVEGITGHMVTVNTTLSAAPVLASLPEVASVRLPVAATPPIPAPAAMNAPDALNLVNLTQLHNLGGNGKGIKLAIIDSDFAGVKKYMGTRLPPMTKLIDLTAERNAALRPEPLGDDRVGRGTLSALAAAQAAPAAELVLIRVDDAATYQIMTVAQSIVGVVGRSESMRLRHLELMLDDTQLKQNRERLGEERRILADNFDSSDAVQKQRIDLQNRLREQDRKEKEYTERIGRFQDLEADLFELRHVAVVANNVTWLDGIAADGTGPLALYLDGPAQSDRRARQLPPTWLQSAGDTNGQSWTGHWLDRDENGALEFARHDFPLAVGRWTRELNFIRWQPHDGAATDILPAGAKIRLTVQWTEAHDAQASVDPLTWRVPLNKLRPIIARQRDASGKELSSDDLVVVARSAELPQMLARGNGWASFEQVIEYTVDVAGTYAGRLEGQAAAATVAPEVPTVPGALKRGEVYPRMTVSVLDAESRAAGRPVFEIISQLGGIGTPGDAFSSTTIGAANAAAQPQPYSAVGSVYSLSLLQRPRLLGPDEFQFGDTPARGTAIANGFVGGSLAAMLSAGAPPSANLRWLDLAPGAPFVVPQNWLNQLPVKLTESGSRLP
jgi:hypothetical protein